MNSVSEASEAAGINSEVFKQLLLLKNFNFFSFFLNFPFFPKISDFSFRCCLRGEMKIRHKTKRGLNTLKFWGCSEILTLILRGKLKSGA